MAAPDSSPEASLSEILEQLKPAISETGPPNSIGADEQINLEKCCVLCRLTERSVLRILRAFLDEFVNDPPQRLLLRQSRGFCREHTRVLSEMADPLATAILYSDLIATTRERWARSQKKGGRFSLPARRSAEPKFPCPACGEEAAAEQRYAAALAAGLTRASIRTDWETQGVLCVAHTEQVAFFSTSDIAAALYQQQSARLAKLEEELAEIIRKHDYRFRGEPWGPERSAWRRALALLCRPW